MPQTQTNVNYLVTMKADGSLYLEDKPIDEETLIQNAKVQYSQNPDFAVVIRADESIDYGKIMALLDKLKGAGITKFGLATDTINVPNSKIP